MNYRHATCLFRTVIHRAKQTESNPGNKQQYIDWRTPGVSCTSTNQAPLYTLWPLQEQPSTSRFVSAVELYHMLCCWV